MQSKPTQDWVARIAKLSSPLAKLSVPDEGWEKSALRIRFMNAGLRGESAPMIYFGIKTLLAIVGAARVVAGAADIRANMSANDDAVLSVGGFRDRLLFAESCPAHMVRDTTTGNLRDISRMRWT